MATAPQPKRGKRSPTALQRPHPVSPPTLHQCYIDTIRPLSVHFVPIDSWLAEHESDVWRQLHQADDELLYLRQIGVSESRYRAALGAFVVLCEEAERLYHEAHPSELSLPPLAPDECVAVYYELSDGSMHKVSGEDE